MCGIIGLISTSETVDFDALFPTLAHRGPDGRGVWQSNAGRWRAKLGHHRLSIIDLVGGTQPMTTGEHTITFNGEIYNFKELRDSLGDQNWRTRSDTEVVLNLIRQKGPEGLSLLDGFFAFGLYDRGRHELLMARDRWGIKPLYYSVLSDGGILFASELHPFLRRKDMRPAMTLTALRDYLFFDHVPYDQSILKGVKKLMPGQYLRWRDGQIEIGMYYDHRRLLDTPTQEIEPDALWDLVRENVRRTLISDVPVGVLLSGGIDSSIVAAAARDFAGPGLPTFSIGFEDSDFDESDYARLVAQSIQAEHHEVRLNSADLLARWEEIVTGLDEPLADPSLLPTRILCELARRHVPVVLGGDGGDELFGGYPTYRAHSLRPLLSKVPFGMMKALRALTSQALKTGDGYQPITWRLKRLLERFDPDPFVGHFRWMSATDVPQLSSLTGLEDEPDLRQPDVKDLDDLQKFLYFDLLHYLPYTVLTKVDRASMAVGLECRPPFLANSCVEAAFAIPIGQKVSVMETKIILREAALKHLPEDIVDRPKRGFAIPLAKWLKKELASQVEGLMTDSPLWGPGTLRVEIARHLWSEFKAGYGDHSRTIWALLVLHKWAERNGVRLN